MQRIKLNKNGEVTNFYQSSKKNEDSKENEILDLLIDKGIQLVKETVTSAAVGIVKEIIKDRVVKTEVPDTIDDPITRKDRLSSKNKKLKSK